MTKFEYRLTNLYAPKCPKWTLYIMLSVFTPLVFSFFFVLCVSYGHVSMNFHKARLRASFDGLSLFDTWADHMHDWSCRKVQRALEVQPKAADLTGVGEVSLWVTKSSRQNVDQLKSAAASGG